MMMPLFALLLSGLLSANSVLGEDGPGFPQEFVAYAKKHGCRALEDKPYIWGLFEPAGKKESAVFWCKTKEDEKERSMATIIVYIKDEKKLKNFCPPLRLNQPVRKGTLELIRVEKGEKSKFQFDKFLYSDNQKPGPREGIEEGAIIKNATTPTAGSFMICHKKRWLASYFD